MRSTIGVLILVAFCLHTAYGSGPEPAREAVGARLKRALRSQPHVSEAISRAETQAAEAILETYKPEVVAAASQEPNEARLRQKITQEQHDKILARERERQKALREFEFAHELKIAQLDRQRDAILRHVQAVMQSMEEQQDGESSSSSSSELSSPSATASSSSPEAGSVSSSSSAEVSVPPEVSSSLSSGAAAAASSSLSSGAAAAASSSSAEVSEPPEVSSSLSSGAAAVASSSLSSGAAAAASSSELGVAAQSSSSSGEVSVSSSAPFSSSSAWNASVSSSSAPVPVSSSSSSGLSSPGGGNSSSSEEEAMEEESSSSSSSSAVDGGEGEVASSSSSTGDDESSTAELARFVPGIIDHDPFAKGEEFSSEGITGDAKWPSPIVDETDEVDVMLTTQPTGGYYTPEIRPPEPDTASASASSSGVQWTPVRVASSSLDATGPTDTNWRWKQVLRSKQHKQSGELTPVFEDNDDTDSNDDPTEASLLEFGSKQLAADEVTLLAKMKIMEQSQPRWLK